MKFFEKFFKKKSSRKEYFYVRYIYGFTFTFLSDIALTLSEEIIKSIADTIINATAKGISGDNLAKEIFEQINRSNEKICALEYSFDNNGHNWLIEVNTHSLAFRD